MNKLRVFQIVNHKRTASGNTWKSAGTVLFLFLLLPGFLTGIFGNLKTELIQEELKNQLEEGRFFVVNRTKVGEEKIPLEYYVADMLGRVMDESYEEEALKAQAVLIRSNLLKSGKTEILMEDTRYGTKAISQKHLLAVAQTKGMYLEKDGEIVYGAYHRVSNGFTRSGNDFLGKNDTGELNSVSCEKDFLSEEFTDTVEVEFAVFEKEWEELPSVKALEVPSEKDAVTRQMAEEILLYGNHTMQFVRDSAGYVMSVCYLDKWVLGEDIRYAFGLSSSDFRLEQKENKICFITKGKGHGFGMSQFGANEMAKEGSSFLDILSYFFENTKVTRTE